MKTLVLRTTMEVDLTRQATNYMRENFIGKLDETTLRGMAEWLGTQLEKERTGKKQ